MKEGDKPCALRIAACRLMIGSLAKKTEPDDSVCMLGGSARSSPLLGLTRFLPFIHGAPRRTWLRHPQGSAEPAVMGADGHPADRSR